MLQHPPKVQESDDSRPSKAALSLPRLRARGDPEGVRGGDCATQTTFRNTQRTREPREGPCSNTAPAWRFGGAFPVSYGLKKPPGAEKAPSLLEIHNSWEILGKAPCLGQTKHKSRISKERLYSEGSLQTGRWERDSCNGGTFCLQI